MVQLDDQPESKDMEGDTQPISYAYPDAEEETQEVKVFSDVNLQTTNYAVLKPSLERNGTEVDATKEDEVQILETPPKPPPIMVDLEDGSDAEGGHGNDIANPASPASSADLLSQTNSDDEADTQLAQTFLVPETILEDSDDTLMDQTRPSSSAPSADSDYESQAETSKVSTLLKLCYEVVKANIERFESIRPDVEPSENGSRPRKTWRDVYYKLLADANFNSNVPRDSATTELSTEPAEPSGNISQPSTSSSSTATITCQGNTTATNGHRSDSNSDRPTTSTSIRNARGRAPTQPAKDIPVITLSCDSPPPSPPPCAPYTAIGRSISNEVVTLQENCYREIRECINKKCQGTHQVPSDNTLTMLSIEMPVTWTEMGKIPGMSERTRFIYWPHLLKITKRYRSDKLEFYKTCHFPTTLQQAKDLCSSETSNGRNRKRTKAKRNRANKRKQTEEAVRIVTSEDESSRSDSPAVTSASPPAKRTRRARASKPTESAN